MYIWKLCTVTRTIYSSQSFIYFLPRLAVGLHIQAREGRLLSVSSWNFLLHKNESVEHMKTWNFYSC